MKAKVFLRDFFWFLVIVEMMLFCFQPEMMGIITIAVIAFVGLTIFWVEYIPQPPKNWFVESVVAGTILILISEIVTNPLQMLMVIVGFVMIASAIAIFTFSCYVKRP